MLAQIESLECNVKLLQKDAEKERELLQKDIEKMQKDAEKERELLQKDVEKMQKEVVKERELRELAVKAAQAEFDRRILDLTFHGDYGELRKKIEDIKESVSGF